MKKISRFVAVALCGLSLACNSPEKTSNTFSFSIQFSAPETDKLIARFDGKVDTFLLDSGKFATQLPLTGPSYIELQYGENFIQVFGAPGQDLQLQVKPGEANQIITYSGSLQAENEYVEDRRLFDEEQVDLESNLYTAGDEDFILVNDSLKNIRLDLFEKSKASFKSTIASEFVYLEQALIKTKWLNRYMEHELYFPLFTEEVSYTPLPKVLAYKKDIDPNDERLLVLDEYLGMLDYYIDLKKKEANPTQDDASLSLLDKITIQFATVDKAISNKKVQNEVKFRAVQKVLNSDGIDGAESFINEYIQTVNDPLRRQELQDDFKKWQTLAPGADAPEIVASNINGDTVKLSSFRGKYVYLDLWATWCRPCRDEIPFLEKMMEEMDKQGVQVISISIDEDKATWEKMVSSERLKGVQLIAEKNAVLDGYNLKTIPRYVIIDPNGKIVSSNAERPSGAIREQLKNLIKPTV